jgi:hypothetical protein
LLRYVCLLDPGSIQREHLHVDTSGVHISHAPAADILKLLENLLTAGAPTAELFNETPARPSNESRAREVFFKGDGPQFRSSCDVSLMILHHRRHRHRCRNSANPCSIDKVAPDS